MAEVVPFNVLSDLYGTFMPTLRGKLAGPTPEKVKERPVLAKQTGEDKQPPKWIHVELIAKGGAAPKVAIRSDNVYIIGFTNSEGKWFELIAKGKKTLLPGATALGFDGSYRTLVGGPEKLPNLKLGMYKTSEAAVALWGHRQKTYVNADLKEALATLCVVLAEAARFAPIYKVVNDGWSKQGSITIQDVNNYIKNWGDLSSALLGWKRDGYKNDAKWFKNFSSAGIDTGVKALEKVELLLNKPPKLGLLAWLKYLWGVLLVKKPEQVEENYQKADLEKSQKQKSSAIVNPL